MQAIDRRPLSALFPILNRLPEPNPDIEHAQARADTAGKAVFKNCAEGWKRQEQMIVRPLRTPRQDHQHDPNGGAQEYEQQDSHPAEPEV